MMRRHLHLQPGFAQPPAAPAPSAGSRGGCAVWWPHAAGSLTSQVVQLIAFGFAMI